MAAEADQLLRRIERTSVMACAAIAVLSWAVAGWRLSYALGALGGGAIVAISYRGIKAGIDAVTLMGATNPTRRAGRAEASARRRAVASGLVKFFTRYAILAVAAYVIMARLRLPPVAVIAGASSLVVAVTLEAVRPHRKEPPHNAR
jgi:hypothetical protein